MAPLSGVQSFSTLSGFVHPTRCSKHRHSTETGSHHSSSTPSSIVKTTPKIMSSAKTSPRPVQTGGFILDGTRAATPTTMLGPATNPTETRHAAASHLTVTPASTTLAATHPSSPVNSLLGNAEAPSPTPDPTVASTALTHHVSTKIGLAFLGVVLLVAASLWVFFFGSPKYRRYLANCRARKEAQAGQRQWWDWIKADRQKPWVPARSWETQLPQTQHLSRRSSAVLHDIAAMSPLRASGTTTVDSWPLRSVPRQSAHIQPSISMTFPTPSLGSIDPRSASFGTRHDCMRSYETYRSNVHQVYTHSDQLTNPYQSPTVFMGAEDARVVRLQSASPEVVQITKSRVRRVSYVASIGDDTDDGFEEVNLLAR
ncbi:hypothetical protein P171DRAFT_479251 [Karstenula rhodostoma CBS 690.94]|uniref:Uncharacterized protein n=1 Tax=Karstenula rhodostoma CBS 690.94 TaxID=1392251 RepID=A0A9P4PVS1_9PLEO|nr:hypothetical protein P171DRAFT_479251 [Karstenula rhodostoma CBS 690.94]